MTIDLNTTSGRIAAYRDLWLGDHGVTRSLYRNFFTVAPGVYRSSQPSPLHVRSAARKGVKTIVNLRGATPKGFYLLEEEACEARGVELVNFIVRSRELPDVATLKAAKELFANLTYPVLFHCKSGADRAGIMSALYLLLHLDKSAEEASAQLSWRYGHYKVAKTGVLDEFFDRFIAARDKTGIGLWDWIESDYDPVAIKREFQASRLQTFIVDKILKRE